MKFEAAVHKWLDVSENDFGIALLNDCKYGARAGRDRLTLSLLKSGTHPDPRGDEGVHYVAYSILPHGAFSAEVVQAAYELNVEAIAIPGADAGMKPLLSVDKPNVIVESVKWAESAKAFVVRVYEATRNETSAELSFGCQVKSVDETNLLEEEPKRKTLKEGRISFRIKPFEIKTFLCYI